MNTELKIVFPYEEGEDPCVALINAKDGVECMFWNIDEIKEDPSVAFDILNCTKQCYEDPETLFNMPHIQSHYQSSKKYGILYEEYI